MYQFIAYIDMVVSEMIACNWRLLGGIVTSNLTRFFGLFVSLPKIDGVMRILLIHFFLGTSAAYGAIDDEPLLVHKDWVVGCDNWRSCQAVSLLVEDSIDEPVGDGNLAVVIKRDGRPQDIPAVGLTFRSDATVPLNNAEVGISVDDREPLLRLRIRKGALTIDPKQGGMLISAMKRGKVLSVVDAKGKHVASASLHGLFAALAYMDAKQFRTGTRSALANPGNKAANASSIPPMPPRPIIRVSAKPAAQPYILSEAALEPLLKMDPCLKYSKDALPSDPKFHRLDNDYTVLILPTVCGGYNPTSQIFVVDNNGGVKKAQLLLDGAARGMEDDGMLTDAGWDDKARLLSSFGRGRGLADCGEIKDFVWSQGRFWLTHSSSMSPCRGSFDYITTYRVKVIIEERSSRKATGR